MIIVPSIIYIRSCTHLSQHLSIGLGHCRKRQRQLSFFFSFKLSHFSTLFHSSGSFATLHEFTLTTVASMSHWIVTVRNFFFLFFFFSINKLLPTKSLKNAQSPRITDTIHTNIYMYTYAIVYYVQNSKYQLNRPSAFLLCSISDLNSKKPKSLEEFGENLEESRNQ